MYIRESEVRHEIKSLFGKRPQQSPLSASWCVLNYHITTIGFSTEKATYLTKDIHEWKIMAQCSRGGHCSWMLSTLITSLGHSTQTFGRAQNQMFSSRNQL